MNRCSGHCCERFVIDLVPERVSADLQRLQERVEGGETLNARDRDDLIVLDMIVPLPEDAVDCSGTPNYARTLYTCRHFDTNTRNCMNYEKRPSTCRRYPYGAVCAFKECTWDAAREGRAPAAVWLEKLRARAALARGRELVYPLPGSDAIQEGGEFKDE